MFDKRLFQRKSLHGAQAEQHGLKRHLGAGHLTMIGIGAIIGAGIFVITGQAAADYAGPSIVLSFLIAALVCLFAGLCYAELSAMIPISGGSYSYAYVAMGEFPAWLVGWAVTAQYLIAASTVAVGWSGYFVSFLADFNIALPQSISHAPIAYSIDKGWEWTGAVLNVPAIAVTLLLGVLVSVGIKAVTHFNNLMVIIKLSAILLFLCLGFFYIDSSNWTPFIPANTGIFGEFGWSGILRASGLVFFAYIGFDTVATLAQDAIRPQKDLPIGILSSLTICTLAYILTALVLTGVVSYTKLGVPDPMSVALNAMDKFFWLKIAVKLAILAGLASVVLVQMLGQTRVFYAVGKDGLLPPSFCHVHPKTKTPLFSSLVTVLVVITVGGIFPINVLGQLVSMTTLFLFSIVCLGVWLLRKHHPEFKRPFKVPFVPWVPLAGITACVLQMLFLPLITWVQISLWLGLGLFIYFLYGVKNSKLRNS
jgi:APA family basic amino acid/polyamine antiporter